jgi:hypothetical protein
MVDSERRRHLGCAWPLTGDSPDERGHFPGDGHHHLGGMFPPCREGSETLAQAHLSFPSNVLDDFWSLLQSVLGEGG